jgi:hypothetical protein
MMAVMTTIPPISTKQTITSHLSPLTSHLNSLNIQKTTTYRSLGFYVLIVLFLSKWMRFMHIAFICVNYAHHFHER